MKDVQRVTIVDPSDITREPLRNLLLGIETVWLEAECTRYEFFIDVARQGNPDLVIISLDADHTKALHLIQQLAIEFPNLPILAVSGRADGPAILQAWKAGVKEFLTQPVVLEDLLMALQKLRKPSGGGGGGGPNGVVKSMVISIVGSRGGVGCTSLAVNLGVNLAQDPNHDVALIDLDLALGDCDVALDMVHEYTLADLAMNIDRLDMGFLRKSLCKHSSGLSLLPHPMQMEDIGLIHEDHLQRVINLLRASYTHLLFDLSKRFTPTDMTAMRMSDIILLVAQLELTSLRNVVRMLHTMGNEEGVAEKVQVVINRVGSEDSEITLAKAEETIEQKIFWQIPNDYKAMMGARNAGLALLHHAPRSKAHLSLMQMANHLCGKAEPEKSAPSSGGGLISSLFGKRR